MSRARYIVGDSLTVVRSMPDASVDVIISSPPFLALRSYLPADHPDKAREIGSEATPADFLQTLLVHAAEWRRVLAPHGSIAVELGDTYSGSGGAGGDYAEGGLRDGQAKFRQVGSRGHGEYGHRTGTKSDEPMIVQANGGAGWPLAKSLCGIPHLFHLSLAYGRNLLTGEPSPAGQWRVRNVICWARPNPPVGALGDKVRPATSYMTIATIARDRYFDLDAVRTEHKVDHVGTFPGRESYPGETGPRANGTAAISGSNPAGAPPLDWWEPLDEERALWDQWADEVWQIPTAPYKGSHYATWPPALCVRPIEMMTPRRVCTTCGEPSRRITERTEEYAAARAAIGGFKGDRGPENGLNGTTQYHNGKHIESAENVTVGWSSCGHDTWRNGVVLDPFAGSGTTLAVATGHGRDAIGVDLDERNAELARERVGWMFLDVEYPSTEGEAA